MAGGSLGGLGGFGRISSAEVERRVEAIRAQSERRADERQNRIRAQGSLYYTVADIRRERRRQYNLSDDIEILQNQGYYTPAAERFARSRRGEGENLRTIRAGLGRRLTANIRTQFLASGGIGGLAGGPLGALAGAGIGFAAGAIIESRVQSEIEEINASVICLLYTSPSPRD